MVDQLIIDYNSKMKTTFETPKVRIWNNKKKAFEPEAWKPSIG